VEFPEKLEENLPVTGQWMAEAAKNLVGEFRQNGD
jgi:hypothetical protein